VPNNGKPEAGLYQIRASVKIVNRDNTPRRPGSKIRSECRGINSKILLALSDPQLIRDIVRGGRDKGDGDNRDKKNSPLVR